MNRLGVICFVAILYISGTCGLKCKKCEQTTTFETPDISKCAATKEETCDSPKTKCGAVVDTPGKKTTFACFAPTVCSDAKFCCDTDDCNNAITGGKDLSPAAGATTAAPAAGATTAAAGGAAAKTTVKTGGAATPAASLGVLVFLALAATKAF